MTRDRDTEAAVRAIDDHERAAALQRRFTNIWKDENGAWRRFARHANVIPSP